MLVSSIQYNQPAFCSWRRDVNKGAVSEIFGTKKVKYRNDTWIFRPSLVWWNDFMNFIDEKYKNIPKVNIYDFACSDGTEVYNILLALKIQFGDENMVRFLPIIASDIDEVAIRKAQQYDISFDDIEEKKIENFTRGNVPAPKILMEGRVSWDIANILKDYGKIIPDNSIVFARNFWPYLELGDKIKLAKNLYKKLGKNSLLVLGEYDHQDCYSPEELLPKIGFKFSKLGMVYEK